MTDCNTLLHVTDSEVMEACKLMARHFYGSKGVFAYEAYDHINAAFFGGALPFAMIQWAITAHGGCLGQTSSSKLPIITMHPSLLRGSEKADPWGMSPAILGVRLVYDVLLHECIHVAVNYIHGGATGPTSHNSPEWIGEVNRILPMLDIQGVIAGKSTTKRFEIEGSTTKTGKAATRVERVTVGNVPFKAVAAFPYGVRTHLGMNEYYKAKGLPFACSVTM